MVQNFLAIFHHLDLIHDKHEQNIHQYLLYCHLIYIKTLYVYVCMFIVFLIHTYSTIVLFILLFFCFCFFHCLVCRRNYHTYIISILCLFHTYCISVMLKYSFFLLLFISFKLCISKRRRRRRNKRVVSIYLPFLPFFCVYLISAFGMTFFFCFLPFVFRIITSKFVLFSCLSCMVVFFCFCGRLIKKMGRA